MAFDNLTAEEAEHIQLFIKHFVSVHKQHRWVSVLSMKPEKWIGASAYDCNQPVVADWNTPTSETIKKCKLESYLGHPAYVFRIGAGGGNGGVFKSSLRQALVTEPTERECVVSIIPGKLAICYGHSNEFRLCKRT